MLKCAGGCWVEMLVSLWRNVKGTTGWFWYISLSLCEVIIWIGCDFCNCFWRTLRTKRFGILARRIDFLNFNDEEMRRRGFESVILGWGLTAALVSVLMVSPLAWVLPDMLWRFLFPRGRASVVYLLLVACCDGVFDTIALLITTHLGSRTSWNATSPNLWHHSQCFVKEIMVWICLDNIGGAGMFFCCTFPMCRRNQQAQQGTFADVTLPKCWEIIPSPQRSNPHIWPL